MTIEELKALYFRYGCNLGNMYRDDTVAVNEICKKVAQEQRIEWCIEYMDNEFQLINSNNSDAGYAFVKILTILSNRNIAYKNHALKLVEKYKECPFVEDSQRLIVAEAILGRTTNKYSTGYSVLCFYGDFKDTLKAASAKYQNFEFNTGATIYSLSYSAIELNERAEKIKGKPELLCNYIDSDEYIKDKEEVERQLAELLDNKKSKRRYNQAVWGTVLGTVLVIALLLILVMWAI